MVWKPNVTVAAVAQREGHFLLIEEMTSRGPLFNQPAGHLEPGESLVAAVAREALEESAYSFRATALLGVYHYCSGAEGVTYLRFAFAGEVDAHHPDRALDHGILRAVWLPPDDIRKETGRHRSPLVMRCIDDYLAGNRYPLSMFHHEPP
jgi:8-oxo-dGTP pyrophosphatase MutT (NUDIX family)